MTQRLALQLYEKLVAVFVDQIGGRDLFVEVATVVNLDDEPLFLIPGICNALIQQAVIAGLGHCLKLLSPAFTRMHARVTAGKSDSTMGISIR